MTSTMQSPSSSRPGRKGKRAGDSNTEPGQKPKKVNSEVRKQQNRIASRNYREKRKRKLQYLQQLLHNQGPSDQQASTTAEAASDPRARSVSTEYNMPGQTMSPVPLPSSPNFNALSSTTGNAIDSVLATTASYEAQFLATSHPYSTFEPPWAGPVYDHPPAMDMATWSVPQWLPNVSYSPHMVPSALADFQYTPPHTQTNYEPIPTPPQEPEESASNGNLFILGSYGHCRRSPGQAQGISSCMENHKPFIPRRSVYI